MNGEQAERGTNRQKQEESPRSVRRTRLCSGREEQETNKQ